jgi:ABC-2 type transport system ATP-binding protein
MDHTTNAQPATSGTGTIDRTGVDDVIRASGLGFSYGDFAAVESLDLTVRRGELYALLGTNGAGKTTTLEVLEGHRRPTAGRVEVLGGDPADRARTRPRVGIMLQDSGLAARQLGDAGAGLARDELWDVVRDLRDEGVTFLLTTHYLEEAERHADRIGLMHRGTLRREGTVADLTAGSTTSIRFVSPVAVADLPLTVSGTENGLVVVTTTDAQRDVAVLLTWATENGHRLERFATHESGLDDVFRALSRDA